MLDKILLPLDGSDAAEDVFPYGEELARRLGSEIILFHACVPEYRLARNMHRLYLEKTAELMQERLKKDLPQGKESQVRAEYVFGDFAKSICSYVAANDIGLVIMAAYGFTSARIRKTGSVADKIFRLLRCPTLLIRAENVQRARDRKKLISHILLPLDGSHDSEVALPIAQELALKLEATITLFRMTGAEPGHARGYLEDIARKLRQQGVAATGMVTSGDDRAKAITGAVKKADADLVIMATRGRSPTAAWAPGSIAHKLLNMGGLPLLIVSKAGGRPGASSA